ncbi:hypothetical protein RRG08_047215 [Elysia crispata]|uniref:Uncharacterized protein n=1 Tax=Elysia crispata TaxID=231223 RepID=A0AAE1B835_9GAST|nr:hypothetical protein RRG08_047215 [Elysia crispata]
MAKKSGFATLQVNRVQNRTKIPGENEKTEVDKTLSLLYSMETWRYAAEKVFSQFGLSLSTRDSQALVCSTFPPAMHCWGWLGGQHRRWGLEEWPE